MTSLSGITCKPLKKADIPYIIQIANACFGQGYLNKNNLHHLLETENCSMGIYTNQQLTGFCLVKYIKTPSLLNVSDKQSVCLKFPLLSVNTIAVHPSFQNNGLGTKLLNDTIVNLQKFSDLPLLYPSWNENDNPSFVHKAEQLGFKKVVIIENYWKQESVNNRFICKRCGAPPCLCSVTFYLKN